LAFTGGPGTLGGIASDAFEDLRYFPEESAGLPNLRLYHEVSVLDAAAQRYEYINCHPGTGLLRPGN
jgi:Haem-containing dehydratase